MVPRVGDRVGPYEILGRLGSGGMGLVYSAWDVRLQRDVAIKLLREEYLNPGMRSRFLQEARAASRLNHPNICTVFDIGEQQGDPFLVMELLKGETVRSRITRDSLSIDDTLGVAMEVADALIVAHAQGVVHRDIKPANIMLVPKTGGGSQAKVLDFGLAKVDTGVPGESRFDLTSTGTTVGTVSYMSPEQARGESLDARSDLFSLGVVLYEMATGKLPFQGATSALVFVQLLSHRPEPVRELNIEIPKDFERIISKLLEKNRSDRFQTARDLVQALARMDSKRPGAVKTLWSKSVSRSRKAKDAAAPPADSSSRPQGASPLEVSPKSVSGNSVLRPIRRMTTGDIQRSQRESLPPAASPFFTSPLPPGTPSPIPPMVLSKQTNRPAAGAPAGTPKPVSDGPATSPPASPTPARTVALPTAASPGTPSPELASPSPSRAEDSRPSRFSASMGEPAKQRPKPRFERIGETAVTSRTENPAETPSPVLAIPPAPAGPERQSPSRTKSFWIPAVVVVLCVAGALTRILIHRVLPVTSAPVSLTLGSLNNLTGDDTLADTIEIGLRLDLEQSPALSVLSPAGYEAALRIAGLVNSSSLPLDAARRAAQSAGVKDILFGEITSNGAAYTLTVRVYDSATGAKAVEVAETASSREQIPGMLDRLATDLRSGFGESGDSIIKNTLPLEREATANLDALHAYANGYTLTRTGHFTDGIAAFEHAASLDAHFPQTYIRLAELYRRQHAEVAAAEAANNAQLNASTASNRTQLLAQSAHALDTTGDLPYAVELLEQMIRNFPGDMEAHRELALAQRLEGKYSDSLTTAQNLLKLSPYNEDSSGGAEIDLIALDRVEAAAQLEQQEQAAGLAHPGIAILLNYLHAPNGDSAPPHIAQSVDRLGVHGIAATVLDAQGQMAAGLAEWKGIVDRTHTEPALISSASYALSQAALDRALAADCVSAQDLIRQASGKPAGPHSLHALGMAAGLCGNLDVTRTSLDLLTKDFSQDYSSKMTYIPNLTAVVQWKSGDASGALDTLKAAKQTDLFSLTPFLRGIILLSSHQGQLAIIEFQAMLLHRGATTLTDPVAYPVSQIGLARAYLDSGDKANSSVAYAKFLLQWSKADPASSLMVEARIHSHL